ncbi:SDR family NAD(P)-dependent oxidoreductase [Nesterenkonia sp. LB17]|uniref:SDR family oxidoreductase n=1 Tax=unclassified Nesterenkonia TaxID=2629769 RepID=UPI001F4C9026|nr:MULTISPECIES: SDR family oxidoreductase [unclassified Nesterenkonia]MCH8560871.1 SDR family NAD(P)-dependent oxidoreductase [Nesterenkonia sp. DZ6]MCH8563519.1 SDR family NAD(P)-dependent oxidoreductase [Nesterenkonia sp. YGD6]MCH8566169.1 SDR family NAD(P)-dependent oxidoreductase [Nesterenkonia sp. LB17]MCH8570951.1 SDR family NAD(P)-dependent oxidoreductase [Nesterenkonia sp. AY15]
MSARSTSAAASPRFDLSGRVALVTGATRGAGRAIARELAGAGAVLYCTGRSSPEAPSDYGRSETVEETARLISDAGGTAHPVIVDHLEIEAVRALIARIDENHGRLDILVNDIGGEAYVEFGKALWDYDLAAGKKLFDTGFTTHLNTSHSALPLLIRNPGGLVVEVTDGTRRYNASHFRENAFLDLTKTAVDRLAFAQGHELAPHGGTAVSVSPGWLRSEMMLDGFGVTEQTWRAAAEANRGKTEVVPPYEFVISETPAMLARGITALAADPARAGWNTRSTSSFELAQHYELTDVDGSRPDAWSFITEMETTDAAQLEASQYR